MTYLEKARSILLREHYRLVLCGEDATYFDTRRGVAPLLALLDDGAEVTGFAAADRVVGKAAAFLYLRLGVTAVYAQVISDSALALLTDHGVEVEVETVVPQIRNRAGDGYCPMETVCLPLADPVEAEQAVRRRLAQMKQSQNKEKSI